jgi:hypothetical protein
MLHSGRIQVQVPPKLLSLLRSKYLYHQTFFVRAYLHLPVKKVCQLYCHLVRVLIRRNTQLLTHPFELTDILYLKGGLAFAGRLQGPEGFEGMMSIGRSTHDVTDQHIPHRHRIRINPTDTLHCSGFLADAAGSLGTQPAAHTLETVFTADLLLFIPAGEYTGKAIVPYPDQHFFH